MPVYVVTGCSGGLGLGLVKALAARGDKVYATVRKRATTATGEDQISNVQGDITVIETSTWRKTTWEPSSRPLSPASRSTW